MVSRAVWIRGALIAAIAIAAMVQLRGRLSGVLRWNGGAGNDEVAVLVSSRYISAFEVLKPADVEVRHMPREYAPIGYLTALADLTKEDGQPVFTALVGIPENQVLSRTILSQAGRERGLSSLLRPGKVAVSFSAESPRAAGGWIEPGDTIALFESKPNGGTQLLLESLPVLGVDKTHLAQAHRESRSSPSSDIEALMQGNGETHVITVMANTAEASRIVDARERGDLSVVLRSLGDDLPWIR